MIPQLLDISAQLDCIEIECYIIPSLQPLGNLRRSHYPALQLRNTEMLSIQAGEGYYSTSSEEQLPAYIEGFFVNSVFPNRSSSFECGQYSTTPIPTFLPWLTSADPNPESEDYLHIYSCVPRNVIISYIEQSGGLDLRSISRTHYLIHATYLRFFDASDDFSTNYDEFISLYEAHVVLNADDTLPTLVTPKLSHRV